MSGKPRRRTGQDSTRNRCSHFLDGLVLNAKTENKNWPFIQEGKRDRVREDEYDRDMQMKYRNNNDNQNESEV